MRKPHQISDRTRNIFVLCFALILCWFMYDRLSVISNSTVEPATILSCDNSWTKVRSGSSTTYRDVVISAPVAMTEDGQKATGTVKVPEEQCDKMIGTAVKVYVHKTAPEKSRINSLLQFWLFPAIFGYLIFMMLLNAKRPFFGVLTTLIFMGGGAYLICAELNIMNLGKQTVQSTAHTSPSQIAFDHCIKRVMLDKDIARREDITRLVCQSDKISDLSSIADLVNLEELYLQGHSLTSLESFAPYPKLKKISLAGSKTLPSTRGIINAPNLEEFYANKAGLTDLAEFDLLKNLTHIQAMMNEISDISQLAPLNQLEEVVLSYNPISDISALANKSQLTELQIYASNVTDLTPLYTNVNLMVGGVTSAEGYPCEQILHLKSLLKSDARFHVPDQCKSAE